MAFYAVIMISYLLDIIILNTIFSIYLVLIIHLFSTHY